MRLDFIEPVLGLVLVLGMFALNYRRIRLAWTNPDQLKQELSARQKSVSWLAKKNSNFYGSDGFVWFTRFQSLLILFLVLFFLANLVLVMI